MREGRTMLVATSFIGFARSWSRRDEAVHAASGWALPRTEEQRRHTKWCEQNACLVSARLDKRGPRCHTGGATAAEAGNGCRGCWTDCSMVGDTAGRRCDLGAVPGCLTIGGIWRGRGTGIALAPSSAVCQVFPQPTFQPPSRQAGTKREATTMENAWATRTRAGHLPALSSWVVKPTVERKLLDGQGQPLAPAPLPPSHLCPAVTRSSWANQGYRARGVCAMGVAERRRSTPPSPPQDTRAARPPSDERQAPSRHRRPPQWPSGTCIRDA
ncbi:hypothetical protein PCL_02857 [Purpureocillium lilacinum]|uniref:Uncharacterized protein n=1 Tax=Purpureocillium lilacinum TaxID=33203 RepID=A0A2U3DZ36_PURLI|nr:hypothetical protein Purlil1_6878 [Purpureocillium lilacinum]PWI67503.1 hypothetical protein PCL_02857 [Purpureocillium lilacinum]